MLFAATGADVRTVVRGGVVVVNDGTNLRVPNNGRELYKAVAKIIGAL